MKKKSLSKVLCTAAVATSLVFCLAGMSGCNSSSSSTTQVAATVGDKTITEDEVTTYIENMRTSYSATEDSTWAMYLEYYFGSAKDLREQVITYLINEQLVFIAADEYGLSVSSDTIDSYVNQIKSNYSTDDAWQTALTNAGLTEESYRKVIEYNLLYQEFVDKFGVSEEPTDDEVLALAKDNIKYFDGMRRSSHILFSEDDEETAQSVLDQLKAGTLSWDDAVSQYSTDTSSASSDDTTVTPGDVGWDILNTFVQDYETGLSGLAKGEMSDLVKSSYGYHIIKCTDVFNAPSSLTSLTQLPDELTEFFRNLANTSTTSDNFSIWLNAYKTTQTVTINDMPSGLSYDIDVDAALAEALSAYSSDTSTTTTDSSSSTTTDSSSSTSTDSSSSTSSSSSSN